MPKLKDLTGQHFGKLVVIERGTTKNKKTYWKCKCECGNYKEIYSYDLTSGRVTSCGCNQSHYDDLTNKKFGRLTALYKIKVPNQKDRGAIWHCKCDCGNECNVRAAHLKNGRTKSCGCLQKEKDYQIKNLTGQKFGKLTVIKLANKRIRDKVTWHCKCDCGNEIDVISEYLIRGFRLSCGCLKESYGVIRIKDILEQNNINYEQEKVFIDCKFLDSQCNARFDFYVDNKYIIEFDGEQHYNCSHATKGWNNEAHLKKTQEHDKFKNQWCKDNNIPLIRIPYYIANKITLKDLTLETTKYRVV